MDAADFIIELRRRYVRFERGERKQAHEERAALERQRRAHRAEHKIVAPPFTSEELVRRGRQAPPKAPGARR